MPYGPNVIPTMTGDSTPSGTAFISHGAVSFHAWKAMDGDDAVSFMYVGNDASDYPFIFGYQSASPLTVTKFRYKTYTGGQGYAPIDFTFQGSNDGSTYTTLHTVTGETDDIGTWHEFTFANSTSYTYYRMNITASGNSSPAHHELALMSFEMFEDAIVATTWDTDAGDGDGANAANWSNGLPDADTDAIIIGSGVGIIVDSGDYTITCKTLDMSGFDGSVGQILPDDGGTKILEVNANGDVTLSADMTVVVPIDLHIDSGVCVLTDFGKVALNVVEVYGELTLTADLTITGYLYTEGTVNQGAYDVIYDTTTFLSSLLPAGYFSAGGFFIHDGTVLNWSAGAALEIVTGATVPGPTEIDGPTGVLLPPIVASGDGALTLGGTGVHADSFLANDCDLATTSAVNIENSAVAHDCAIATANFSGGTELDATDGCTDGGGNTNVNFGVTAIVRLAHTQSIGAPASPSAAIDTTGATLLVAALCYYEPFGDFTPVDSEGNTWTRVIHAGQTGAGGSAIWYCNNPTTSATHTFTAPTGTTPLMVAAYSGTAAIPLEYSSASAANGDTEPGSITPASAGALVISAATSEDNVNHLTVDDGFTLFEDALGNTGVSWQGGMADLIQTAAAAANPTWAHTLSSARLTIASFRSAAYQTIWTGTASDGDICNAANWSNGLPDETIDAIIGGSDTALVCLTAPYVLTCKGLDMSGFTGSVGDDDGDVFEVSPHGAVVLTSAITVNVNGGFAIDEGGSYTLTTGGLVVGYLAIGAGETVTLADDLVVSGAGGSPLSFGSAATLVQGTHDITIRPYTGDFPMNIAFGNAAAVTWSGGATITLDFAHTNTGSTFALNGNVAITLPPFVIETSGGATGEVQIGSFKAQSLSIAGPNITANHYSLETIGDYTLDQATVLPVTTGQVMTIGGAATATDSTITDMDFSGGSTLFADVDSTDGGGNTNVTFAVPAGPPVPTSVTPDSGSPDGLVPFTILGTGFSAVSGVTFGGTPATGVSTVDATHVTGFVPAHAVGAVTVVVTNGDTQTGSLVDGFTYETATVTVTDDDTASGSHSQRGLGSPLGNSRADRHRGIR